MYFDILYHSIVPEVLVMSMYYYLYSDDEYVHVFVEDEVEYYDNDDDFVLLKQKKQPPGFKLIKRKVCSFYRQYCSYSFKQLCVYETSYWREILLLEV